MIANISDKLRFHDMDHFYLYLLMNYADTQFLKLSDLEAFLVWDILNSQHLSIQRKQWKGRTESVCLHTHPVDFNSGVRCNNVFICVPQGITYDHVEMNLYLNGKHMHCPASGIRGTVYPVVYGEVYCWKDAFNEDKAWITIIFFLNLQVNCNLFVI